MNYSHSGMDIYEMETFQKNFENKFLSGFSDLFKNGELQQEFSGQLLDEYDESYDEVFKSNELTRKTKALIALAVASAIYCPYCMESFSSDAGEYGWSTEQMLEAIQVATAVRCGFATVHAVKKLNEVQEMAI
jgi:AhpD family alkylhydroperoxidase